MCVISAIFIFVLVVFVISCVFVCDLSVTNFVTYCGMVIDITGRLSDLIEDSEPCIIVSV